MRLEVDRLEHSFASGSVPALNPLSHSFEPGTVTVVTGPSGSGKSTLMYLLALMLQPSGGAVRWDGRDVQQLRDAERSRLRATHVGFVFQDAVLDLSRTALDNILEAAWLGGIPLRVARMHAHELMEEFDVAHRSGHLPGEVSGGQAQRIALCRALVKQPMLIFADEPTGNLDERSADTVWGALARAAAGGATVVVATHDTRRAQAGTGALVMLGTAP